MVYVIYSIHIGNNNLTSLGINAFLSENVSNLIQLNLSISVIIKVKIKFAILGLRF